MARHLHTLTAMASGIVGTRSTNLPDIASKVPDGTKRQSRVKKFHRCIKNTRINAQVYFSPYVDPLMGSLAEAGPLLLAMDGSEVGRGCLALMISVIYKKRALPIIWIVVEASKGHFPEKTHIQLVEQVCHIISAGADVIFVGDGEFDGVDSQGTVRGHGWA